MHAAGLGRSSYGPGGLERSRNRLLKQLAGHLDSRAAADTLIVFDSTQAAPNDAPSETESPLTVCFSRDGRDADTEIELLLKSHSSPKQVLVVSSDHRLHKAARRRQARCMDSEDFLSVLGTDRQPGRENTIQPGQSKTIDAKSDSPGPSAADLEADFLNIDVDEIKRSVRKESR